MLAFALVCALLAVLALAPIADAGVDRLRLRRRVAGLAGPVAARPTARAILRRTTRRRDAVLARWLPGGRRAAAQMARAGGRLSLSGLVALSAVLAAAVAAIGVVLGVPLLLAVLLVPLLLIGIVRLVGDALAARAQAAYAAGFADALAVMIRSLRAGLAVPVAVAEVARGEGAVARLFGTVVEDMQLGQPLETALWTAARRIGLPDFDFLVVTIALQRETGGNLAQTLEGLDETLRMRRQLALKIKALAAEARASAMIIGSLPFAMAGLLWMSSPDYLVPLFTTPMGRAMLGAGLASMAVGALVIREMMAIRP
jgi:tight adherence protein B